MAGSLLLGVGVLAAMQSWHEPIRLKCDRQWINATQGHAAPLICDLDGDGLDELLVGQFGQGQLRVYDFSSKGGTTEIGELDWFRAGDEVATVPTGCCVGFGPHLADFNRDGQLDVARGSWPGEIYIFEGRGGGRFAAAKPLLGVDGKALQVGRATAVATLHWDGDEHRDWIIGESHGRVLLAEGGPDGSVSAPPTDVTGPAPGSVPRGSPRGCPLSGRGSRAA